MTPERSDLELHRLLADRGEKMLDMEMRLHALGEHGFEAADIAGQGAFSTPQELIGDSQRLMAARERSRQIVSLAAEVVAMRDAVRKHLLRDEEQLIDVLWRLESQTLLSRIDGLLAKCWAAVGETRMAVVGLQDGVSSLLRDVAGPGEFAYDAHLWEAFDLEFAGYMTNYVRAIRWRPEAATVSPEAFRAVAAMVPQGGRIYASARRGLAAVGEVEEALAILVEDWQKYQIYARDNFWEVIHGIEGLCHRGSVGRALGCMKNLALFVESLGPGAEEGVNFPYYAALLAECVGDFSSAIRLHRKVLRDGYYSTHYAHQRINYAVECLVQTGEASETIEQLLEPPVQGKEDATPIDRSLVELVSGILPQTVGEQAGSSRGSLLAYGDMPIRSLAGLPKRVCKLLEGAGLGTVRDLAGRYYGELSEIPGFGDRSFVRVLGSLREWALSMARNG